MSLDNGGCPLSGECDFAGICESGDTSLVHDAILTSPEVRVFAPMLGKEEMVRSLKELQFDDDISDVSVTMGISVLDRVAELLDVS